MTKEDILKYFKDINFAYNDCTKYDSLSNMLDELEQEPKTEYYPPCIDCHSKMDEIRKAYDNLKEPKAGHWILGGKVDGVYDIAGVKTWGIKCQCDKCGFTTTVIEGFGYYKYCPDCGCRIDGGIK